VIKGRKNADESDTSDEGEAVQTQDDDTSEDERRQRSRHLSKIRHGKAEPKAMGPRIFEKSLMVLLALVFS
jgi:hypothetical protein